jgi:CheY-like chemotaxis protein
VRRVAATPDLAFGVDGRTSTASTGGRVITSVERRVGTPWPAPTVVGERRRAEPLKGVRVLLVEDHRDTCLTYAEGLRQAGADVATAFTAQMALLALQLRTPDVLVVDIGLPDVDGNDFLRYVRARRPSAGWDVPAIALTAYNTPQDRMRTLDAGFRLHVAKPIDPAALGALVARVVHG